MPGPTFRLAAVLALTALPAPAADVPPEQEYLAFVRQQAAALRANDKPPATREEWQRHSADLRGRLLAAWGGFPAEPCPLEAKTLGSIKRDGYAVEKVVFQTRPGVWMTANAYVPDSPGKHPAVLAVHGHWRGAKQDPVVQARCIGPAKLGYFVLSVDAFGAGERGVGTALGEYHGEMTAATLYPVGLPLSGLQVYENLRAVDYLRSRPEVDGDRIGVTGASGGGNQTMYAGAWDDRLKAAVPVCSVGNYQAYLGAACCQCEVVPGALRFTEESGVLALTAPRGLMVVSATRDARQFSVAEAKKSLAAAGPVFELLGKPGSVRHAVFESGHDYNKAMREAMYGWMALHLKGEGDGSPVPEAFEVKPEDPESLRCYPGDTRPADWVTIPRFAAAEGKKLLSARPDPKTAEEWKATAAKARTTLVENVFGGFPEAGKVPPATTQGQRRSLSPEPGLTVDVTYDPKPGDAGRLVVLVALDGVEKASDGALAKAVRESGATLAILEPRATGRHAVPGDRIGRAADHNSAEWGMWIGRPLLGQWAFDVRRFLDSFAQEPGGLPKSVTVIGEGPAGLVALAAAATDDRITGVAAVGTLASFVSDEPYVGQRLGTTAPGVLRDVGDVAHLAALAAPRRVVIAGGVAGNGRPLTGAQLAAAYRPATRVWEVMGASKQLSVIDEADAAAAVRALR